MLFEEDILSKHCRGFQFHYKASELAQQSNAVDN